MICNKCGQPLAVEEQFCGNCGAPRPAGDALFQNAEEQYYLLKRQLASRRITHEQFEAALKQMMIQDAQGRFWVIGPESGKWYVHNGQDWIEAKPTPNATPASTDLKPLRSTFNLVWVVVGVIIVLCLVGGLVFAFVSNQGIVISVNFGNSTVAPTLPPVPMIATSTIVPIVLTSTPVTPSLPTATRTVSPTPVVLPTATMPPAPSPLSPTAIPTSTPILPTPMSTLAPGIYVTGIIIEPPIPNPGDDTFFRVAFLNNTPGIANYRWLVYIYKPDTLKNSFGETSKVLTSIPIGSSEQKIGTWRVTRGACGNYLARVAWVDDGNRSNFFSKPDGQTFDLFFTMCQ